MPMGMNVAECRAMIDAANAAGVTLMPAHMHRYRRTETAVKLMLQRGTIGKVDMATITLTEPDETTAEHTGERGLFAELRHTRHRSAALLVGRHRGGDGAYGPVPWSASRKWQSALDGVQERRARGDAEFRDSAIISSHSGFGRGTLRCGADRGDGCYIR